MESQLLVAVLAGLGGMLGWGLADFFAKKTIDAIGDIVTLAWGHIFGTLVLLIAFLYKVFIQNEQVGIPHTLNIWAILILFGIGQASVYLFVYKGFGKGQVAVLNPIFASFSGISAILSIAFLGEIVTGNVVAGLFVLFLGILFISVDMTALKSRQISFAHIPGFKEIIIATILAAIWTVSWGHFMNGNDWLSYALFMYTFMTITILIIAKIQGISLSFAKIGSWKYLILIGICETIAYLAISLGYSTTTHTSIVAILSGAFSLPTIVLAKLFLKEKITKLQTIGGFVIIVGIIVLSVV